MASTFRRKGQQRNDSNAPESSSSSSSLSERQHLTATALLPGSKVWAAGTTLVSTGLRELDHIILSSSGGGQPLGSCIAIQEDRFTPIANTLLRYWCAEALVHDQAVLIPVRHKEETNDSALLPDQDEIEDQVLNRLPRSLNLGQELLGKKHQKPGGMAAAASGDTTAGLEALKEEGEDEDDEEAFEQAGQEDADKGLVVAWQYRSDVQQERLGLASERQAAAKGPHTRRGDVSAFCHSFDLGNANLNSQINMGEKVVMFPVLLVGPSLDQATVAYRFARTIIQKITELHERTPNRVIRLALVRVKVDVVAVSLPLILAHVRGSNLPVVLFISIGSFSTHGKGPTAKWNRIVQRSADVVLEAESFVSRSLYPPPPEFRQFMGILKVHKASTTTMAATSGHFADLTSQRRPAANIYGVKRDTRKLHFSLLHIPPEEFAAEGSSVGRTAERSGAGIKPKQPSMGCATSGGGAGGGMVVPDF